MQRILNIISLFLLMSAGLHAQVWSPDGKKIAFFYIHAIEDVYTVDADGGNFKILEGHPERDFSPQWSPDGKELIFTSVRDNHHEIYRFNAKGKKLKKLTDTAFDSMDGDYSPDGKSIVFASNRTGSNELFIMNSEGEEVRQLTSNSVVENTPRWSPDGTKIMFLRSATDESNSDIYTIDVEGNNLTQITDTPEIGEFHEGWSSDGSQICYIQVVDGAFQVAIVSAKGGKGRVVVNKKGYQAFYPNWSPDGKSITFTRDIMEGTREGLPALFQVSLDGNEKMLSNKNSFKN
jgi:TolB protein